MSQDDGRLQATEFPITLESVRALTEPVLVMPGDSFMTFRNFASLQVARCTGRIYRVADGTEAGLRVLDADRVVDQNDIDETFVASLIQDRELAELYILSIMSWLNRATNGEFAPTNLVLRKAISERVHQIIEARPELLHPNLRFAQDLSVENDTWMLRYLVTSRVALDGDRLVGMSKDGGAGAEMLKLALNPPNHFGALLFEETIRPDSGCASSAAAIIRAGYDISVIDEHHVKGIVGMCAMAAAGEQWQFEKAVEMLRAIEAAQDARGGDDKKLDWAFSGPDVIEVTDFSWATASAVHPVSTLIYETNVRASFGGQRHKIDVAEFPSAPFAIMAERINAILQPEGRMPLGLLSGLNLLKLITLSPSASWNVAVRDYWISHAVPGSATRLRANTPLDILNWALEQPDAAGDLVTLGDADKLRDRIEPVIGHEVMAEIRAKLAHRDMAKTISEAKLSANASTPITEPAPRRRHRVL